MNRLTNGENGDTGALPSSMADSRLAATFIDGLIVVAMSLIAGPFVSLADAIGFPVLASMMFGFAGWSIASITVLAAFESRFGATPGKYACSLRVMNKDGSPITFRTALARNFRKYSFWLIGLSYLHSKKWAPDAAFHDRGLGTEVRFTADLP